MKVIFLKNFYFNFSLEENWFENVGALKGIEDD
jgi:hypothetical protein